ncbi:hypothetical protein [Halomonas stenophila]|uniref:Uncharacterized protein n=1 Tax=Halomonas stenophila TaxID=795312 RepID=A0A7W5EUF6_9GAMM|nr:hypothetical protein [Halomonas stenophila]MBB3231292.1 hypothetical protein [Halomonas stenophila]
MAYGNGFHRAPHHLHPHERRVDGLIAQLPERRQASREPAVTA